jgi:putative SOS response-associated peptidase YedK
MVITEPDKYVAEVHDRMPAILVGAKDFEKWGYSRSKDAVSLLKPASEDVLQKREVSKRTVRVGATMMRR